MITDRVGSTLLAIRRVAEHELPSLSPLTHAVVAAWHQGRYLLVFNRRKRHWELAGGKIDEGESVRACAVRELGEESGIPCDESALRFAFAIGVDKRRPAAAARLEFGAVYIADVEPATTFMPNDEIAAIRWWDGRAPVDDLSPIDAALIRAISPLSV